VAVEIVFETHSLSEDNNQGIATGWNDGRLSDEGRRLARLLGDRRRDDQIAAVFASDLGRAVETARAAFEASSVPVLLDWRLRECDYGDWNGAPAPQVHGDRARYADEPYPAGESWRQATSRVASFVGDLVPRWEGRRVLVIGHVATLWGLEQCLTGAELSEQLTTPFEWREGWEFRFHA
jgi:2,3-bisphosphoglycerate-dependent phosphoglycerate mutase